MRLMGIGRWPGALLALGALACGRTELPLEEELPGDASASMDAIALDVGTARDATSRDGSPAGARSPRRDAGVDAKRPPLDARAGVDSSPIEGSDGDASCGTGDLLAGDVCVRQTCEPGDQGLECLLAGGGVGHCLGIECSTMNVLTDPDNCGYLGWVCPNGVACMYGVCGSATSCAFTDGGCPEGLTCDRNPYPYGLCDLGSCTASVDYRACLPSGINSPPGSCCGTSCVDLVDDSQNCGYCGHACPGNALCFDGVCDTDCVHSPENTPCDYDDGFCCKGACIMNSGDSRNCNGCGGICPSTGSCYEGSCQVDCLNPANACLRASLRAGPSLQRWLRRQRRLCRDKLRRPLHGSPVCDRRRRRYAP